MSPSRCCPKYFAAKSRLGSLPVDSAFSLFLVNRFCAFSSDGLGTFLLKKINGIMDFKIFLEGKCISLKETNASFDGNRDLPQFWHWRRVCRTCHPRYTLHYVRGWMFSFPFVLLLSCKTLWTCLLITH